MRDLTSRADHNPSGWRQSTPSSLLPLRNLHLRELGLLHAKNLRARRLAAVVAPRFGSKGLEIWLCATIVGRGVVRCVQALDYKVCELLRHLNRSLGVMLWRF